MSTGGGAYSWKYKAIEKEQKKQRDTKLTRERSQALSVQTTQRQRAMEDRKLCMVAAEEERRRKILNERKLFQQLATKRFRQVTEKLKTIESSTRSPPTPKSKVTKLITIPYRTDAVANLPALSSNHTQKIPFGKDCEQLQLPGKSQIMSYNRQRLSSIVNTKVEMIPNINPPGETESEATDRGTSQMDVHQFSELNASQNRKMNTSASNTVHAFQPMSASSTSSNGGNNSVSRLASASSSKGMNWYQARRASASSSIGVNRYQGLNSASASASKGVNSYQEKLDSALASNGGNWYQARRAAAVSASSNGEHMTQPRTATVADIHSNADKAVEFQSDSIVEDVDEPDMVFLPMVPMTQQERVVHSAQDIAMISPDSCSSSQESTGSPYLMPDSLNSSMEEDTESKDCTGRQHVRFSSDLFESDEYLSSYDSLNEDSDFDVEVEPVPIPYGGPSKTKLVGILAKKSKIYPSSCTTFPSSPLYSHFGARTNLSAITEDEGCETETTQKSKKKVRFFDEINTGHMKTVIPGCAFSSRIPLWKTPFPRDNSSETLTNTLKIKHMSFKTTATLSQGNPPVMQKPGILSEKETNLSSVESEASSPKDAPASEVSADSRTCADDQDGEGTKHYKSLDQTPTDNDIDTMWSQIHQSLQDTKKLIVPSKTFGFRQQATNGSEPRMLYNGPLVLSAHTNKKNGVNTRQIIQRPSTQTLGGYGETVSHLPSPQAGIPKKMAARRKLNIPCAASSTEPSKSNHKLSTVPMSALSKEEGQIRESLERIDQKLKGHPGSVSATSTCSIPSPPSPINLSFTQHHHMNLSSGLHKNYNNDQLLSDEDEDYF